MLINGQHLMLIRKLSTDRRTRVYPVHHPNTTESEQYGKQPAPADLRKKHPSEMKRRSAIDVSHCRMLLQQRFNFSSKQKWCRHRQHDEANQDSSSDPYPSWHIVHCPTSLAGWYKTTRTNCRRSRSAVGSISSSWPACLPL